MEIDSNLQMRDFTVGDVVYYKDDGGNKTSFCKVQFIEERVGHQGIGMLWGAWEGTLEKAKAVELITVDTPNTIDDWGVMYSNSCFIEEKAKVNSWKERLEE